MRSAYYAANKERIKAYRRSYYRSHKNEFKEYSLKYKDANHAAILFRAARLRAKHSNMEFNIDLHDIIIPELCPVFGVKLIRSRDKKSPYSATLDRIDNTKGYVKGNVQVICARANTMKNDSTLEELEKLYLYMKNML